MKNGDTDGTCKRRLNRVKCLLLPSAPGPWSEQWFGAADDRGRGSVTLAALRHDRRLVLLRHRAAGYGVMRSVLPGDVARAVASRCRTLRGPVEYRGVIHGD